jgi:hypothetical protein
VRPGIDANWRAALAASGIRTAMLCRLDFDSGPVFVWTGSHAIAVSGTSDTLLDGNTFEPLAQGVMVSIGDNSFSYSGSESLTLTLAIPSSPTTPIVQSTITSSEYQGRAATIWRAMIIGDATASAAAQWSFRRVRAGAMDELSISNSADQHTFTMSVEAHAASISKASGSSYLDQKTRYDSTDTSNDFAVSIANNRNAPSGSAGGIIGNAGGFGGGKGGTFAEDLVRVN